VLASGRALKGPNGEALGAVVAMKDVTELAESRARVIESEERLRTIADNVPALIAYIDTGLRYASPTSATRNGSG
jgi:PAS domain-containing protein